MLIAGLGSTCSVLGGETGRRKASDGMCIVRWLVTTAVVMAGWSPASGTNRRPEAPYAPPPTASLAATPAADETVRISTSMSLIGRALVVLSDSATTLRRTSCPAWLSRAASSPAIAPGPTTST